jgi:uncharacterized protein
MESIFAKNRTALITGASSGIGLELGKALATKLDRVILVARRLERLKAAAESIRSRASAIEIIVHVADLSLREDVERLTSGLREHGMSPDVLVNNAGLGEAELFEKSPWSRIEAMIDVNIVAALRLTHDLLPGMIDRGHGAILNVGSGAGYAAMPNAAVYTATKHFVRAFTESLRAQVVGTGVVVSEAVPGPVDTEFDRVAGIEGGATPGQGVFRISAQECARDLVQAFEQGLPVIFPGRNYRWAMRAQPLMPRRLLAAQLSREAAKLRTTRADASARETQR